MMERAMRLNTRNPYIYKVIYGEMLFNLRDYDDAIHQFTLALDRNPDAQEPRLWRAAAYAYVGRSDDAEWDLEQVRAAHPELSLAHLEEVVPFNDPLQRKHLIDGLFKAGLER